MTNIKFEMNPAREYESSKNFFLFRETPSKIPMGASKG